MYYAMYGEFSNGEDMYIVNQCNKASDGEAECMDELISNARENDCELTFYTCINGMPSVLEDKYDLTGSHVFVDGILMDDNGTDTYDYVEEV